MAEMEARRAEVAKMEADAGLWYVKEIRPPCTVYMYIILLYIVCVNFIICMLLTA